MTIAGFTIFKQAAGIISPEPIWVCFHSYYMYTSPTLLGLLKRVITEWHNDHNIIG